MNHKTYMLAPFVWTKLDLPMAGIWARNPSRVTTFVRIDSEGSVTFDGPVQLRDTPVIAPGS